MNRRDFVGMLAAAGIAGSASVRSARADVAVKVRNVVLVHGLFADGSCWSEVIARLQSAGFNATAVQNPLTTFEQSVAATRRVLAMQDGPTVLVGHSFSGMIITEVGIDPKVSSLVYVAARASRCRRGLCRARSALSEAPGLCRHRLVRRLGTTKRDGIFA